MPKYQSLNALSLATPIAIDTHKRNEHVRLEDPAHTVLYDYEKTPPLTIDLEQTADAALHDMRMHHVRLLLVCKNKHTIVGVIASEDLLGEKPIKVMQESRVTHAMLLVKSVMTPIRDIPLLDAHTLEHAKVGNIIETLKKFHAHHALVVQKNEHGQYYLRGIFNVSQIHHQLHKNIDDIYM